MSGILQPGHQHAPRNDDSRNEAAQVRPVRFALAYSPLNKLPIWKTTCLVQSRWVQQPGFGRKVFCVLWAAEATTYR